MAKEGKSALHSSWHRENSSINHGAIIITMIIQSSWLIQHLKQTNILTQ